MTTPDPVDRAGAAELEPAPGSSSPAHPGSAVEPESIGVDRVLLDRAIGGWQGVVDSGLPTLVFILGYVLTGQQLRPSLVAAVVAGVVIALWRLARRQSLQQVLAGFLGVAVAAFVSSRTGRAENFFLIGLLTNLAYGLAFLVSVLVRRPLMGVIVGYFRGEDSHWREKPREYAAYLTASWIWVGMFGLRLLVQLPLYLAGAVELLGAAKLLMGWPLFLLAAYLNYRVIHPVLAAEREVSAPPAEPEWEPEAG